MNKLDAKWGKIVILDNFTQAFGNSALLLAPNVAIDCVKKSTLHTSLIHKPNITHRDHDSHHLRTTKIPDDHSQMLMRDIY
jgi:hypothetical protein